MLYLMGTVRRRAPGDDGRQYVGLDYADLDDDLDRLVEHGQCRTP
jgi:hypothetical protein